MTKNKEVNGNTVLWDILKKHRGHHVSIVYYGDWDIPCSICLECDDCEQVFEHEAIHHLGLTVPEAQEYFELTQWVKMAASACERTNNEDTRNMYDMMIQELICFEKEHGIMNLK